VETIFVSMPSMMDTESVITIKNALDTANYKDRVFFGVSVLDTNKKTYEEIEKVFKNNSNVSIDFNLLKTKNISQIGTGSGRTRCASLYSGQDYFLQIDSHTNFENGWDDYLISLFKEAKESLKIDKIVLTAYLGRYSYSPDRKRVSGVVGEISYPYMIPDTFFLNYIPFWKSKECLVDKVNKFVPCVKFNGNFAFGDKEFINNSGVYKDSIFYDEEMIQSINLIGNDFAMVFPNVKRFPLTHLYSDEINEFGGKRMYFNDYLSKKQESEVTQKCIKNYLDFINDVENSVKVKKYEKYAKINIKRGAVSQNYAPKKYIVED
jgi:hypothetical protein